MRLKIFLALFRACSSVILKVLRQLLHVFSSLNRMHAAAGAGQHIELRSEVALTSLALLHVSLRPCERILLHAVRLPDGIGIVSLSEILVLLQVNRRVN